jgi:Flp pilus assembly protein TadD
MGIMIMRKQTISTMMATAAIFGSSMVGCSGASMQNRPALSAQQAPALAPRVEQALASKDYASALMQAEELVGAMPNDANHRALLGRAYLANGRYSSARTAFTDALTLGNKDVRTIISLALSETGLGNSAGARALLAAHISDLPAADYGLAMAMAGDPQEGVRALMEAVKQPDATAQTRQNLAYAMALGGAWGQARLIAGQDLSAKDAEQRIGQWSQIAAAGSERSRVFAMVGVSPRDDDTGLPARLALNGATGTQMAAADLVSDARRDAPAVAPGEAVAAPPVQTAQAEPVQAHAAPVQSASVQSAPVQAASPDTISIAMTFDQNRNAEVPFVRASADPMRQAVRAAFDRSSTNGAQSLVGRAGMSRIAKVTAPAADAQASDWVIQLGAFDTAAIASEKWRGISKGRIGLGEFRQIHSQVTLNGRAFHRLAIRGFADHGSALSLCKSLRAEGQACFVRLDDTNSTRMARAQAQKSVPQTAARKPGGPVKQVAVARTNRSWKLAAR